MLAKISFSFDRRTVNQFTRRRSKSIPFDKIGTVSFWVEFEYKSDVLKHVKKNFFLYSVFYQIFLQLILINTHLTWIILENFGPINFLVLREKFNLKKAWVKYKVWDNTRLFDDQTQDRLFWEVWNKKACAKRGVRGGIIGRGEEDAHRAQSGCKKETIYKKKLHNFHRVTPKVVKCGTDPT